MDRFCLYIDSDPPRRQRAGTCSSFHIRDVTTIDQPMTKSFAICYLEQRWAVATRIWTVATLDSLEDQRLFVAMSKKAITPVRERRQQARDLTCLH